MHQLRCRTALPDRPSRSRLLGREQRQRILHLAEPFDLAHAGDGGDHVSALTELAQCMLRTNDDHLAGNLTRAQRAQILKAVEFKRVELGYTHADLAAAICDLIIGEQAPDLAPDVTFRRTGATAPTTPLQGSAPGGAHG